MNIVDARLIRRGCADGLVEVQDHVPLGKVYQIDLDTVQVASVYNTKHAVHFQAEVVRVADSNEWLWTDLLEWAGKVRQ